MTTTTKTQQQEALEHLRERIKPGDTLYTVIRHVARSGMSRSIDLYEIRDDVPHWLSRYASRAAGFNFDEKREALKVSGAGMDMGFHVVYELSHALYPDGFDCIGGGCPASDHNNPPYPDREAGAMHHPNGGYALKHRWM